jgi:hypothetical protein
LTPLGAGKVDLHIEVRDRRAGSLQLSHGDALTLIAIFTAPEPIGEIATDGTVNWFINNPPQIVIDEIGRVYDHSGGLE